MTSLANNQGVLAVLQHALEFPQLQFSDIQTFRQQLASGLQCYSSVHNSLFLGAQAATPGMAFLAGYQNAIRCLDVNCPQDELAAFCVSEKGVKKPWDMTTRIASSADDYVLEGRKGYVMLLPSELDRMYVVAKNTDDQLCCLYLLVNSAGVVTTDSLAAPFIEDIPHAGVRFDGVFIPAKQLLDIDGHQQANKPFRYWEDVHVALAMMAWMLRELTENKRDGNEPRLAEPDDMLQLIGRLTEQFKLQPEYYSLESISLLDESHELMDSYAQYLPERLQKLWLKDRLLLQMGQKIRHLVRTKLIPS